MDTIKHFLKSNAFAVGAVAVAALILLLLAFKAGVGIGYRKAAFSDRWGANYHRNFGGPPCGSTLGFPKGGMIDAHGVFGQIIKIELPDLIIRDRGDVEKIVLIGDETLIKRGRQTVTPADLRADEYVVIIGEPDDQGRIKAKLIRLLPAPPEDGRPFPPTSLRFHR